MKSKAFRLHIFLPVKNSLLHYALVWISLSVVTMLAPCQHASAASGVSPEKSIVVLEWGVSADTAHHYVLKVTKSDCDTESESNEYRAYTDNSRYMLDLTDDGLYTVQVQAVDIYGNASEYSEEVSFEVIDTQVVEKRSVLDEGLPESYALLQNYPNPFNPATTIQFDLPADNHVKVSVFNVTGQKVAELVDEILPAGSHSVRWDAGDMPSGVYVYSLTSKSFIQTRKMMLVK